MIARTSLAAALAGLCITIGEAQAAPAARPAPDFTWTSAGATVHLKDLHGQIVVVNFFASWCPPCREEMPWFVKTADAYVKRGVYFVGVDSGEETVAQVVDFARKYRIDYQLVVDTQGIIGSAYGVNAFPTTFILSTNGSVIFHTVGPMQEGELTSALDAFLAGVQ